MRDNGIDVKYEEISGAHEWKVWDLVVNRFIRWALNKEYNA